MCNVLGNYNKLFKLPDAILDYIIQYLTLSEISRFKSTNSWVLSLKLNYHQIQLSKEIKSALAMKHQIYQKLRIPWDSKLIMYESDNYVIIKPKLPNKYMIW